MATEEPKAPESVRWQFSLRMLLVVVAFVAVGCAALANASPAVADTAYTMAIGVMFIALLGILYRREADRAFWVGFAIFGMGYLLLLGSGPLSIRAGKLATTTLMEYVYSQTGLSDRAVASVVAQSRNQILLPQRAERRARSTFVRIGHSIWTLILAYLGGLLARYFYSTRADKS